MKIQIKHSAHGYPVTDSVSSTACTNDPN